MEELDIRRMRIKQLAFTNVLVLLYIALLFFIIRIFDISMSVLLIFLGFSLLIQAAVCLLKGKSTKALIPIFEQVAIYEKQKMGKEWHKQRRATYFWNIVLSVFMFLQYYMNRNVVGTDFQIDYSFILLVTVTVLILVNISLILHIKKVDSAVSASDLKGYTWKVNLFSAVIGVVLGVLLFFILLFYIISTI